MFNNEQKNEVQSMFSCEFDHVEFSKIPQDYIPVKLAELDNNELFFGKPTLSDINTWEYEKTVYNLKLNIVNDNDESYLDININLKSDNYEIPKVWKGSVLFDFLSSILEIENKGRSSGQNVLTNVNLHQFIDFVNGLECMGIRKFEREGTKGNYNSFQVVRVNNRELNI